MRLTLNKVNAAIAARGGKEILVKGNGYFYFADGEAVEWDSGGVYVYTLNELPLERWIEEWESRRDAYLERMNKRGKSAEKEQQAVNRDGAQDDARAREDEQHGERAGEEASTATAVQDGARAGRKLAEMTGKYGRMPPRPDIRAKVRGDAGVYAVWGFDWMEHRVLLDRAGLEWVDIARVEIISNQSEGEQP